MRKLLLVVLLLCATLVAAFCASSYWAGAQARKQYESLLAKASSRSPAVLEKSYERGVFRSTAVTVVALQQASPGPGEGFKITLVNSIRHGPLALLKNRKPWRRIQPVQGVISSRLAPGPEQGEELKKLLEEIPELADSEIETVLFLDGSGESSLTVPAFQRKIPGEKEGQILLDWGGLSGKVKFDIALGQVLGSFRAPYADVGEGLLRVGAVKGEFNTHPGPMGLAVGETSLSCDFVAATQDGNTLFRADSLELLGGTGQTGDTLTASVQLRLHKLDKSGEKYGPLAVEIEGRKLDPAALARLKTGLEELQDRLAGKSDREVQDRLNALVLQCLSELLAKAPEIELKQLTMRTDKGDFSGKALLFFSGSGPGGPANLLMQLSRLGANVDASISCPLLAHFVTSGFQSELERSGFDPRKVADEARRKADILIEQLASENILVRQEETYTLSAAYKSGKLTLNGRTIPISDLLKTGRP